MSSDPILGFPLIDPNQTGKTLTLNTAIDAIAQSMAGTLNIDASTYATPYTIPYSAAPDEPAGTKTALRFFYMNVTGALSGAWTAYMPTGQYAHFYVANNTSGGFNITIMVSGQTGVTLAPGEVQECYLNGTDVVVMNTTGPTVFTVNPTVPNLPYWTNNTEVGNTAFVQAVVAQSMAYSTWNIAGSGGVFSLYTLGSAATVTYTVTGGHVVNGLTSFPNPGSLYKVGDLLTISGGNQDALIRVATLSGSGIATGTIIYGGTGYTAATGAALLSIGFAPFTIELHGALTGNVTIYLTYGTYLTQGQQYIVFNNTTGAYTVTVRQAGASNTGTGTGFVVPQGTSSSLGTFITTDGETEVWDASSNGTARTFTTLTLTGVTPGTTDLTINTAFLSISSSTILADFSASFVQTSGGGSANTALGLQVDPTIGAANSENWTATFGLTGVSIAPSITSGASGTITGMSAIICSISNLAAGATLTNAIALTINPAVATGTITNNIGANINPGTAGGTTNVDLLIGTATIPTGNFSIYNANTALSQFAGPIKITAATAGTEDLTISPTFAGLASSTIAADINPITNVTAADTANTLQALQLAPTIGATNSKNWTATIGLKGLNIAPAITAGATGTLTGMSGISIGIANNAAGATITNAYGIKVNNAVATGTITGNVGICSNAGTVGTYNVDLLLGTATIPSFTYAIYSASSAPSFFNGSITTNGMFMAYLPFNNAVGPASLSQQIAAGATGYFGPIGWFTGSQAQAWVMPFACHMTTVVLLTEQTPGIGQTYTVTVYDNNAATAMTGTITNGNFGITLTGALAISAAHNVTIGMTLSGGATTTNVRGYAILAP
jgi:hypothetical protein